MKLMLCTLGGVRRMMFIETPEFLVNMESCYAMWQYVNACDLRSSYPGNILA